MCEHKQYDDDSLMREKERKRKKEEDEVCISYHHFILNSQMSLTFLIFRILVSFVVYFKRICDIFSIVGKRENAQRVL